MGGLEVHHCDCISCNCIGQELALDRENCGGGGEVMKKVGQCIFLLSPAREKTR